MRDRHYLFIESNTTGSGGLAAERIVAAGGRLTFVTRRPALYPFLQRLPGAVAIEEVETNDPAALDTRAAAIHARTPFDAILTFSTFYVAIAAGVAQRCGRPALNVEAARLCHEKAAFRQRQREVGLPAPAWWLIRTEADAARVARDVHYPCVVKPTAESGSDGVRLVRSADELMAHGRALMAITANARAQARPGDALVEALLDGPEVSVETFTVAPGQTHVLGVTRKHLSAPPWFVETGHDFPATLSAARRAAVVSATLATLDAVGYDFGPAHTELRLTRDGPVVVELNPRLAGGMIPALIQLATGIDVLDLVLEAAAGRPIGGHLRPIRAESASIRFFVPGVAGQLRPLPGFQRIKEGPLIRSATFDAVPGAMVRPATSARDRLGYVIASGRDPDAVVRAADAARDAVMRELDLTAVVPA
jgi:biotin carboxylase